MRVQESFFLIIYAIYDLFFFFYFLFLPPLVVVFGRDNVSKDDGWLAGTRGGRVENDAFCRFGRCRLLFVVLIKFFNFLHGSQNTICSVL